MIYEPSDGPLTGGGRSVQTVDDDRKTCVDVPLQAALSSNQEFVNAARAKALDRTLAAQSAWTLTVDLGDGTDVVLEFGSADDIEVLFEQMRNIYAVYGWTGVHACAVAVRSKVIPPDHGDSNPAGPLWAFKAALQPVRPRSANDRWIQAEAAIAKVLETLALTILATLETVEMRAIESVLERLQQARDFAAVCWKRYEVQRGRGEVVHSLTTSYLKPTYLFENSISRTELHAELKKIVEARISLFTSQAALVGADDVDLDEAKRRLAQVKDAEEQLAGTISHAAQSPHPLASALAFSVPTLGFVENDTVQAAGRFLNAVITETESWAKKPPPRIVAQLYEKNAWPEVIDLGPEAAIVARLHDAGSEVVPLALPQVLAMVEQRLRNEGDTAAGVALMHLNRALSDAAAAELFAERLLAWLSAAGAIIDLAMNLAALFYVPLRPWAARCDMAMSIYGSAEGLKAAWKIEELRGAVVQKTIAEAERTDLYRLGRAVSEHLQPSGLVVALITAGLPAASLEAAMRDAGSLVHFLDGADLVLSFIGAS